MFVQTTLVTGESGIYAKFHCLATFPMRPGIDVAWAIPVGVLVQWLSLGTRLEVQGIAGGMKAWVQSWGVRTCEA